MMSGGRGTGTGRGHGGETAVVEEEDAPEPEATGMLGTASGRVYLDTFLSIQAKVRVGTTAGAVV